MVSPELSVVARELSPRRILVTGGSGFVGSHLARALAAGGHDVTACGRNPYRFPFAVDGPEFARCDLSNRDQIADLCRNCDLVYHVGALTSVWGDREAFVRNNVVATQNVVDGCLQHGVKRLIHVSSTAIQFDFRDAYAVVESSPVAKPFSNDYAWSKAEAEGVVLRGIEAGLNAVIIRARAVFGPGDTSLLPRLLDAADGKRLRQIGSDETCLDLTFVDNLILALILASSQGEAGGIYTITNDEPVELWPFLKQVLRETGHSATLRQVPRSIALAAAGLSDRWHRWRGAEQEPKLTRYAVGLLSTSKTFDISAARRELGYKAIVSMTEGTRRTIAALKRCCDEPSATSVGLRLYSTGYTSAKAHHAERGASRTQRIRFHALIAVITHPIHGVTLFDTGYAPRFFEATRSWPYRIYRQLTPVVTNDRLAAVEVLKSNGIERSAVHRILLSHFHADHLCGLIDFPQADVIANGRCWNAVRGRKGASAIRRAFLPDLLPRDLENRLFLLDNFHDPGFGPFERCHDLFADGSVRVFELSGHAVGQIGILVQRSPVDRVFLVADAAWTSRSLRENLKPTWPFRVVADRVGEATVTQQRLHQLQLQYPQIEIIPTHCPEVAARYEFDAMVNDIVSLNATEQKAVACES